MKNPGQKRGWVAAIACICWMGWVTGVNVWGETKDSVETRLKRLEDREEIRRLIMDYGNFLDRRDFASFSALFSENAGEWIGGMGKAKGRASIRKLMEETIGNAAAGKGAGPNLHLFTNESIEVKGNEASATTKWIFVIQNNSKQPQPFYVGHYQDTFVRESGGWKFLRRVVYGDIPADDPMSRK
jgi:3-phenylpropionate/cinnamic acid dioxygenase small subunit